MLYCIYTRLEFFRICSIWTKLHAELLFPAQIFLKNDYPENFINKYCFVNVLMTPRGTRVHVTFACANDQLNIQLKISRIFFKKYWRDYNYVITDNCTRSKTALTGKVKRRQTWMGSFIRPPLASKVVAILLPVKDVAGTLICLLHF